MKTKFIFLIISITMVICGCTKAGIGGNATVVCKVYNSDDKGSAVNGVTVYIKYGQSTPPSANNTGYDDHKIADAAINTVTFTSLKQGTYYFYAEGKGGTTTTSVSVSGGAPFSLTHANRNGTSNAIINVMY